MSVLQQPMENIVSRLTLASTSLRQIHQSMTYYKDAMGKEGQALKNALHEIIDDHTQLIVYVKYGKHCAKQMRIRIIRIMSYCSIPETLAQKIEMAEWSVTGTANTYGRNHMAISAQAKDRALISITSDQRMSK